MCGLGYCTSLDESRERWATTSSEQRGKVQIVSSYSTLVKMAGESRGSVFPVRNYRSISSAQVDISLCNIGTGIGIGIGIGIFHLRRSFQEWESQR